MQTVEIADNRQCGSNKDKNVKGASFEPVPPSRHSEVSVRCGPPQGRRRQ